MGESQIEWCTTTWNPVTGCSKVSEGCRHCYAETLSLRFGWTEKPWTYPHAAENVVIRPERLSYPLKWRDSRVVFVNSMSDLFHERVPFTFIDDVFAIMAEASHHTFQVLTKRPRRMLQWFQWKAESAPDHTYIAPPNVWIGVSVEDMRAARTRIPELMAVPAVVRFLSCEPLLGPLDLTPWLRAETARCRACSSEGHDHQCDCACHSHGGINWVIVGGESGRGFRPMEPSWARQVRDDCRDAGVPFFFKQWGGRTPKAGGRELDGQLWDETPVLDLTRQLQRSMNKAPASSHNQIPRNLSLFAE
jgi:protein gp37